MNADLERWKNSVGGLSAEKILIWAAGTFKRRIAFASSLGMEDQVITHMIATPSPQVPVFTLDTGRLFPETRELIDRTRERYGIHIRVHSPEPRAVEEMVGAHGEDLYLKSPELRRACCGVRKLAPLKRALEGLEAWICGLRQGQSSARSGISPIDWDEGNGLIRICPLASWTEERVRKYVSQNGVPVNPLHDRGYPSIGCACCTRPVAPGEDPRSGRWWWEQGTIRECGLHRAPEKKP